MKRVNGKFIPHVLTLDDDSEFNYILQRALQKLPLTFSITTDPKLFLNLFESENPDLCLIDLQIGKYNIGGHKLIKLLRLKHESTIPLIIFSKFRDLKYIIGALDIGASDYLSKPLDDFIFQNKICHFLHIKNEDVDQDFVRVPSDLSQSSISLPLTVSKVSEDGITLKAPFYIAKGSYVNIDGAILKEITGKTSQLNLHVSDVSISAPDQYELFLEFDNDDPKIQNYIRSWIANKNTP
ncbi:MAG: response regulator [Oligoflexia bacterium]|nr:response regulator [Oligoflexia bacterium]MBF0364277.1 response regulator [Oligoflexia bacterium]